MKMSALIDLIDLDRNHPSNPYHPRRPSESDQVIDHRSPPSSSLLSLSLSSPSSSSSTLVSSNSNPSPSSSSSSSSSPSKRTTNTTTTTAEASSPPLPSPSPSVDSDRLFHSFKSTLWFSFCQLFSLLWSWVYSFIQNIIILLFTRPMPSCNVNPSSSSPLDQPIARVAIIGAGITGISSAAHFLSNRFEVVIFEQSDSIGGIWSRVNSTSSLQLDSFMYRFHPSIKWSNSFPVKKGEILGQLKKVWNNYQLSSRTRFNFTVEQVSRQKNFDGRPSKWIINNGAEGLFDAVVVAIGTCGPPERVAFKGRDTFTGTMVHSSELDRVDWNAKRVAVLGGGASAVEALELAVQSGCATPAVLVTRTDKWFIPRNIILGTILALNPLGIPSILDKMAEKLVRKFHYGSDLEWMSPAAYNGKPAARLYSKTPIVNGEFLNLVRQRRAHYVRAKINRILPAGIEIQSFSSQEPEVIPVDVIVEATGYKRPSLDFLPCQKLFQGAQSPDQYAPPNLYLQSFVPNDWSCLMTNAGYYEGIGTVGHNHIGILSRILMMFFVDPKTAPNTTEMRGWVDRMTARKGSLHFFTYSELSIWLTFFLLSNPRRWAWLIFVGTGWGGLGSHKIKTS